MPTAFALRNCSIHIGCLPNWIRREAVEVCRGCVTAKMSAAESVYRCRHDLPSLQQQRRRCGAARCVRDQGAGSCTAAHRTTAATTGRIIQTFKVFDQRKPSGTGFPLDMN